MNYYDFLKEVRKLKERNEFVKYNNNIGDNEDFAKLTADERFCIKAELYNQFKLLGYKDSKNFSFLITIRPI